MKKGFSLIETLVVVVMFAVLATIAAQSTSLSLRSARKSDSLSDVRGNLDNAISVMERALRNSQGITSACNGVPGTRIDFLDEYEVATYFRCLNMTTTGYVASGSARLTSDQIDLETCQITCTTPTSSSPAIVDIVLSATNSNATGLSNQDKSSITVDTRVNLRVY